MVQCSKGNRNATQQNNIYRSIVAIKNDLLPRRHVYSKAPIYGEQLGFSRWVCVVGGVWSGERDGNDDLRLHKISECENDRKAKSTP